jgi:TonB family protein
MKAAMKNLNTLLVAAVVILGWVYAFAGDVKIIANSSVRADSISASEIRGVFLEDKRSLRDGSHVEPVLAKGGSAHETFLKQYLGTSDDVLRTHYRTLVFTGTGDMPKSLGSDAEIVKYVASTRGAIGYVDIDAPVDGAKVLTILQAGVSAERRLLTRVDPEYPETLQQLQIGGTVRLILTISPKGNVESVRLVGGNPILAEAATKAARQWVYAPGPSRTSCEVSIPFVPKQ